MISKAKWQKYVNKLAAIDKKSAELMEAWVNENGLADGDALIRYAYGIATKYGEASAELACEMYDLNAAYQGVTVPPAVPADTATMEEVAKSVTWAKYHSPGQVPSVVERLVKRAGADTQIKNAIRDGAEWAWVPSGDTCAFCITLASRGWQKASKKILKNDHAEHIHAHCDCQFAIVYTESAKRKFDSIYDPEKYEEMYFDAEGRTPQERINAIRRMKYQQNREYINAQKRDAYQAQKINRGGNSNNMVSFEAPPENISEIQILKYSDEKSLDIKELLTEEEKRDFEKTISLIDEENMRYDAVFNDSSQYLNALLFGNDDYYRGQTVGNQHSSAICLSKLWKDPQKAFEKLTKDNRHIKTDDPMSIYAHEYGHYLIDAIALKRAGYQYNNDAPNEVLNAFEKEKGELYFLLEKEYYLPNILVLDREISERGAENVKEFVAECFSQYFCGNEHSEIADDVVKFLLERWNNV